jgi:hypothetical protein
VQIEPHSINLNPSKIGVAGTMKVLNKIRRKTVGATVHQIDRHPSRCAMIIGSTRSRFRSGQLASAVLGSL